MNDYFFLPKYIDVCNIVDDTAFNACNKDSNSFINSLEHDILTAIQWLKNNNKKLIQYKFHPIV